MKKTFKSLIVILMAIILFTAFSIIQAHAVYDAIDMETKMIVGETRDYASIKYRTDSGLKYLRDFESVTSSAPDVISAEITGELLTLKALKGGESVITATDGDIAVSATVTVVGENNFGVVCCREDKVLQLGEELDIGREIEIYYDDVVTKTIHYRVTCSDENVIYVYDSMALSFTATQAGEATITIEVLYPKRMVDSFKITVPKKPAASKPVVRSQTSLASHIHYGYVYADRICPTIKLTDEYMEYEIYVSDKKDTGFKKVGWIKTDYFMHFSLGFDEPTFSNVSYSDHDTIANSLGVSEPTGIEVRKYNKKKLQANKAYYVKVRARYTDVNHKNKWSAFSDVKVYWTAPTKIKKSEIKYTAKTGKLSFPKAKNVTGYIYLLSSFEHIGYNVFGQKIYLSQDRRATTTKNSFITKKIDGYKFAEKVTYVYPYAKHNGYYFADNYKLTKSLKKFEYYEADKWVGKN